ncbi:MAG TPA: WcaI family glycosyltransferase [Stellaceae bacterium]|nr:WcaI family glycosyltransferase [Stellaceae bacterium]
MRILVVGLNFAPELTGVGKYSGEMAAWLARRGHHVSVVTTRPYYPQWTKAPGLARWTWRREAWQGCDIVRCPLYVPQHMNAARRILHLGSFALSSVPAAIARAMRGNIDLVLGVVPTLLSAPLALAVARSCGAAAWLHVQDLEIDAAGGVGLIQHRRLLGAALALEAMLIKRFDLVSAISPKMLEAIARKGVAAERLMLFPNWVDMDLIYPRSGPDRMRAELGLPADACVVLYSGSMGRKQGLDHVIAAARRLSGAGPSPVFVLAGAGPALAELRQQAEGLANVRFQPLQPEARFNEFLNMGDIHLLPQKRDAADLVMPSKLGAMLAAGKPVIATVPADSQVALTLEGAGVVVPPEDDAALAGAIAALAADEPRRRALGEAALRRARESLDAEAILSQAETRLKKLVESKTPGQSLRPIAKSERRI